MKLIYFSVEIMIEIFHKNYDFSLSAALARNEFVFRYFQFDSFIF